MDRIDMVQTLVGDINKEDLKYVDYYVSDNFGIFIPSVGFCQYAIRPRHTHPAYSFILFFSKEQPIVSVEIDLQPTEYLVTAMSPKVPHEEEQGDTFTRYMAIFIGKKFYEKHYSTYAGGPPDIYVWTQFPVQHDIMALLKKYIAEYDDKLPGQERVMEALAVAITHQIIRSLLKISISTDNISQRFEIEETIEYMHQNYGKKLTIKKLARIVNMSESHFTRVFKKETGTSPLEYLIKLRLDKAKKILRSGTISITEVALNCGFNSSSHFSTCFTKHYGLSPSEYGQKTRNTINYVE